MTETKEPVPGTKTGTGRGLKIAFAISVALNLAILGMVAGAWLQGGGPGRGMPRDLSFGPFGEALSRDERQALRRAIFADLDGIRAERAAAKAEFETLLTALRAEPHDPVAIDAAFASVVARYAGRMEKGRKLLEALIADMSTDDRQAFADRLEVALRMGPGD